MVNTITGKAVIGSTMRRNKMPRTKAGGRRKPSYGKRKSPMGAKKKSGRRK